MSEQGRLDEAIGHYSVALKSNPEESVEWLKKGVEAGFGDWESLRTNRDWENIRSTPYYIELTNRHP